MARKREPDGFAANPHQLFLEERAKTPPNEVTRGDVIALHRMGCVVEVDGDRLECKRVKDEDLCVGDAVAVDIRKDGRGVIEQRLPRRSWYYRGLEGGRKVKSVTANMDAMAIVVSTMEPDSPQSLIDRFMVLATLSGMHPVICVNKIDLVDADYVDDFLAPYHDSNATCLALAALEGRGVEALRDVLVGKRTVFCGHSGVGKSTLINALVGDEERLRTGGISASTGKGTHTTTWVDWIRISDDTVLVDTPGIKHISLGMLAPRDIAEGFAEFTAPSRQCRFEDCLHQRDPECGVRAAVEQGVIHPKRRAHYLSILENP